MSDLLERIGAIGVVPVIAIDDAKDAIGLADALLEGGLPVAEITFRTPAAAEAIAAMHERRPELLVGAGTLLDHAQVERAMSSGAGYGLAPGFDPALVKLAERLGLPFAPGIMTPSELGAGLALGQRLFKFFPAGIAGGPKALEGISAPFAHLKPRFIPTGGVTEDNIADWLAVKTVLAIGGTWIARSSDIASQRWGEITERARRAVERVRAARGYEGGTKQ